MAVSNNDVNPYYTIFVVQLVQSDLQPAAHMPPLTNIVSIKSNVSMYENPAICLQAIPGRQSFISRNYVKIGFNRSD